MAITDNLVLQRQRHLKWRAVDWLELALILGVAFCLIWYGYINYLRGFGSFRLPSGTPIASLYAIIPLSGVLIALFTVEQLVNGLRNGFDHPEPPEDDGRVPIVEGSREGT